MGLRGPAPKPTRLKVLAGNPGKRPLNAAEPRPDPTPPVCPAWLDDAAKTKWRATVKELSRLGVLTSIDGDALAAYCQAWAEFAWATKELRKKGGRTITLPSGYMQPHPAVAMQRSAWQAIKAFSALFGLDPSSRSRIRGQGGDGGEVDPLTEMMNRNAARKKKA